MNTLYKKYLLGVRWVELALAFGTATLADLQLTVQGGGKVDQNTVIKAVGVGAGVAWAYLRMPKDQAAPAAPAALSDGTALPEGIDATGPADDVAAEVVKETIAAVLAPSLGPAASNVAGNVLGEVNRVLKRGIKWDGRIKL